MNALHEIFNYASMMMPREGDFSRVGFNPLFSLSRKSGGDEKRGLNPPDRAISGAYLSGRKVRII